MRGLAKREIEFWQASRVAPVMAAVLGGALLVGGCTDDPETVPNKPPTQSVPAVAASVAHTAVEATVSGKIDTLTGEPVMVFGSPFGMVVGSIADETEVQIVCQSYGPDAPGDPKFFGKPPMSDWTWYKLGDPANFGKPMNPERWIPQNPVFTDDPIPSCPPQ